jgi:APA family basic amino acid/polyamine antiporter
LGTLNAWVLTSGQIALGAAEDGHLPKLFRDKNSYGSPQWGLVISSLGMIPVLIATLSDSLIEQVNFIVEVSVTAFLFIYSLSVLSYLKLFWVDSTSHLNFRGKIIGVLALIFCSWTLYSSGLQMVAMASLVPITGIPLYYWNRRKLMDVSASSISTS